MQKILIVEDDNDINSLLRRILTGAGYQVVQAYSGTEALLQYQSVSPDLVLLDLMLPGLSGSQVLGKLRGEMSSDVPIIILSGKDGLGDKVALLEIGAEG